MSVEVSDITFHYDQHPALQDISFSLKAGSFNALLGANGAGKSTLFSLLSRLYALQKGQILINNHCINQAPSLAMQQIGIVFQQSTLDLDLTVSQNLHYHSALHGISSQQAKLRISQQLTRFDLQERQHHKVRSLNGGHRRRVEIARALLHQPSLLLLDEATVGLDPQTRSDLNHYVRTLCQQQQLTVLWATHLIEEINDQDNILLLHKGKLHSHSTGVELCQQQATPTVASAFNKITQQHRA